MTLITPLETFAGNKNMGNIMGRAIDKIDEWPV
jgi:hypothetical protein